MNMFFNFQVSDIKIFISNNFTFISLSFISILLSVLLIRKLKKDNML